MSVSSKIVNVYKNKEIEMSNDWKLKLKNDFLEIQFSTNFFRYII